MEEKTVRIILPETEEISTLRHSDGISYINYEEFKIKYPHHPNERLSGDSKYVVKNLDGSSSTEFPLELNAYSSFSHPCIHKPKAWTYDKDNAKFYMVSKRGKNIYKAYEDKDIKIEEIISDIMSAIAFLNYNGYAHGDIKPDNIIYYKGKAKLIDMSRFIKAKLNSDGQYYVNDILYTYIYRDPEYTDNNWTNIKCEIYSLAYSIKEILQQKRFYFGSLYGYKTGIFHLDWFFDESSKFIEEREDINYLLNNSPEGLIVRRYTGNIFTVPINDKEKNCDNKAIILMSWLIEVAYLYDIDTEALFLCLHLIYRLFPEINRHFKKPGKVLQIFGCVCMNLALSIISFYILEVKEWFYLTGFEKEEKFNKKYDDILILVLELSRGVISTLTYWDYASSDKDLRTFLLDMANCSYNPSLIRGTTHGNNKCITVKQLLNEDDLKMYNKDRLPKLREKITEGIEVSSLPCKLNFNSDTKTIEDIWQDGIIKFNNDNIYKYFPLLMCNRNSLVDLRENTIKNVYRSIYELGKDPVYWPLVDKLMNNVTKAGYKWRSFNISVNYEKYNPFK